MLFSQGLLKRLWLTVSATSQIQLPQSFQLLLCASHSLTFGFHCLLCLHHSGTCWIHFKAWSFNDWNCYSCRVLGFFLNLSMKPYLKAWWTQGDGGTWQQGAVVLPPQWLWPAFNEDIPAAHGPENSTIYHHWNEFWAALLKESRFRRNYCYQLQSPLRINKLLQAAK